MVEDGSLEALELIIRLEPELLVQQPPARAVDLERVCLAAAAIEGQHQLAAQTLAQRMLGDAGLELRDDRAMASELEHRLESPLDGLEAKLLEAPDLALGEVRKRKIGEGRPTPDGQCPLERTSADSGSSCSVRRASAVSVANRWASTASAGTRRT